MRVRLLGPVEVEAAGKRQAVAPPQVATVLAVLAANAGRVVSTEALVDKVWGDVPPYGARRSLHTNLARLRRVLDPADVRINRRLAGYELEVDPDLVDLLRFRALAASARERDLPPARQAELLRAALELWRGEPMTGLAGDWAARARQRWHQEWLDANVAWARAEAADGRAATTIETLTTLADEHPLSEPVAALLISALHGTGRTAEALEVFARVRATLADQLGSEPGAQLRAVHKAVLLGDPAAGVHPIRTKAPAQLPLDLRSFVGREDEIRALDRAGEDGRETGTAPVIAISGAPGIGKTSLAVRWARRASERYPDGQLYVNLRGADPTIEGPLEAIRGLLEALGIPPKSIPSTSDAMVGLYRSALSGRRVMILLDNAHDAEQVRPLLASAPGCLTLVTSRRRLAGLQITQDARLIELSALAPSDARQLLAARLGRARTEEDPATTEAIISYCAGLPLALAIVAAKAAAHATAPLSKVEDELRAERGLDAFADTDPLVDLRAVFARSVNDLSSTAAEVFRLFGLAIGVETSVAALASLAGQPTRLTETALAELVQANLASRTRSGRYAAHDLLRSYAVELCQQPGLEKWRSAALGRLLDHYLLSGLLASRLRSPTRREVPVGDPPARVAIADLASSDDAMAWFSAEHPALLAAIDLAIAEGFDEHVWRIAWTVEEYLQRQGRLADMLRTQEQALDASRRLGDPLAEAISHNSFARSHYRAGNTDAALASFRSAAELLERIGDDSRLAHVHLGINGVLVHQTERYPEALGHVEKAIELFRRLGDVEGEARALNTAGWNHGLLGDYDQMLSMCQQSQGVLDRLGQRYGQAHAWDSIGHAHHHLGDFTQACDGYRQALRLFQQVRDRHGEAWTLVRLGDSLEAGGEPKAAARSWQRALAILDDIDDPKAETVRAKVQLYNEMEKI